MIQQIKHELLNLIDVLGEHPLVATFISAAHIFSAYIVNLLYLSHAFTKWVSLLLQWGSWLVAIVVGICSIIGWLSKNTYLLDKFKHLKKND
jgi:hypothetical protein